MWNNIVGAYARRGARNGVIAGLILAALAVLNLRAYFAGDQGNTEAIVGALFGIGALSIFYRFGPRLVNVEASPDILALSRYGVPITIAGIIDIEVNANSRTITLNHFGRIIISDDWIVRPRFFGVAIRAMSDVSWVYERVTRHYNWFIPIGRTNEIVTCGPHPESPFSCTAQQAAQVLEEIRVRAPYLVIGWTQDREDSWNRDSQGFVSRVSAQRLSHSA
jgi:hypothetical protein